MDNDGGIVRDSILSPSRFACASQKGLRNHVHAVCWRCRPDGPSRDAPRGARLRAASFRGASLGEDGSIDTHIVNLSVCVLLPSQAIDVHLLPCCTYMALMMPPRLNALLRFRAHETIQPIRPHGKNMSRMRSARFGPLSLSDAWDRLG